MKKRLRERVPHWIRKRVRRLVVWLVPICVPLIKDILNIAATNGLDLQREWQWTGETKADSQVLLNWNLHDFLKLMDAVADQKEGVRIPATGFRSSIIVPAHNGAECFLQCLLLLVREVDLCIDEIIVINNGSSDETSRLLSHLKNLVRVIDSGESPGFAKACNQAAAIAAGRYLVFLNSDVMVQPEWLTHLVYTIESDPSIAAVGSMLLSSDGRLQEAGGIIWRDGSTSRYGSGEDQNNTKLRVAREVDYSSATALLVRKDLFSQLNGFDERLSAGYLSADICLGIRSLGGKVIYQPLSRAVRHEDASAANDQIKRDQEENQRRFADKWRDVLLKDYWDYRPDLLDRAANRRRGSARIIVFDSIIPAPDKDSGSARMFMILKSLTKIARTVFVPVFEAAVEPYASQLSREGVEVVPRSDFQQLMGDGDCEIAILSRIPVADEMLSLIRRANKRTKVVFDTVDIYSLRLEREYQLTGSQIAADEAALRRRQERRLVRTSDRVWCVTNHDKNILEKEVPGARIRVIPNIHQLHSRGRSFRERKGLLFIGSFLHRPNRDALEYYIKEIHPLVCESLPSPKLYVVGSHITQEILGYASGSIEVVGHLRDVDELFYGTRVFVAPLRYGSGMKGKIGHAFSYGLPVVTTSVGAEGFGLTHGAEAMLADNPVAFAEAVTCLYRDPQLWQRLSDNGYRYVEENLSPPVVHEKIVAAIGELLASV